MLGLLLITAASAQPVPGDALVDLVARTPGWEASAGGALALRPGAERIEVGGRAGITGTLMGVEAGWQAENDHVGIGVDASAATEASASGRGVGFVGAEGFGASARGDAFIGGRATVGVPVSARLCGLETTVTGSLTGSYGAGASAQAVAVLDWSSLTLDLSAEAATTLGLGGGLGSGVRVDLSPLKTDRPETLACLAGALSDLTHAVTDVPAEALAGLLMPRLDWALPPMEADFDALLRGLDEALEPSQPGC